MTAVLVYLEILESLVVLVAKDFPESRTHIQEAPDPKASPESPVSQEVEVWTELEETMDSREVQATEHRRVSPVNLDVPE